MVILYSVVCGVSEYLEHDVIPDREVLGARQGYVRNLSSSWRVRTFVDLDGVAPRGGDLVETQLLVDQEIQVMRGGIANIVDVEAPHPCAL